MIKRDRGDRGALIALGLVLATIVLIAVLGLGSSYVSRQSVTLQNSSKPNADSSESRSPVAPSDFDFHWFGDSWAQWAMALFGVVATGVSWRALILIRRTFEETKRTADAAETSNEINRQIFYATNRPYLDIREVNLGQYKDEYGSFWWVSVEVENSTGSRAVDVSCETKIAKRPLAIVGNSFTAEFARNSIKNSRAMGPVIVPINGSSVLFDRGADDLPKQGKIGGWMITVCVKYRSNVNPEFYYIAASYNAGGISQLFAHDPIDGSSEAEVTATLIADSQSAT